MPVFSKVLGSLPDEYNLFLIVHVALYYFEG